MPPPDEGPRESGARRGQQLQADLVGAARVAEALDERLGGPAVVEVQGDE
ncbi:hypothetical protein OG365_21015 [Streptomyces sp. NBC_00853]|nr:hypothetical protein OG365_21015 [Streptomyces sp. NBC_00853]